MRQGMLQHVDDRGAPGSLNFKSRRYLVSEFLRDGTQLQVHNQEVHPAL